MADITAAAAPALVAPDVPRLEATELGELMQSTSTTTRRPLVVDVRDPGTSGGFIKGAVNIPKVNFEDESFVDSFLQKYAEEDTIVFHCFNSNGRGPFCAGRVHDRLPGVLGDADRKPKVRVLKGGFRMFSENYGSDSDLIDTADLPLSS